MEVWATVLSALLTPMLAIVVAVIAFLQWRTAHQKVVLELFERRISAYEDIIASLRPVISNGSVKQGNVRKNFLNASKQARFLFGDDVASYLDELWNVLSQMNLAEDMLENADEQRQQWAKTKLDMVTKTSEFFTKFPSLCEPYIRMDEKRVRTPWRWFLDIIRFGRPSLILEQPTPENKQEIQK